MEEFMMLDEQEEMELEHISEDEEELATPTKKKGSYSFAHKLDVVDYAQKNSNKAAANKYKISRSRVQEWRKQEAQLRQQM